MGCVWSLGSSLGILPFRCPICAVCLLWFFRFMEASLGSGNRPKKGPFCFQPIEMLRLESPCTVGLVYGITGFLLHVGNNCFSQ